MIQKFAKIGGLLVLLAFLLATLAFTSLKYNHATCNGIEINYDPDEVIKVDRTELVNLVKSIDKNLIGKDFDSINTVQIEEAVEKHEAILNAEVYKVVTRTDSATFKGVLAIDVQHRKPVVRIFSDKGNYYLDEFGGKIPVSTNYAANVLVATGNISEEYAKETLLPCVLTIENDEFWNAQIEQIHVQKDGDVLLIPLVGDHTIEFGGLENYPEKLRNMKAFYKQIMAKNNWNKYKTISLKYKDQVIAKRR
ncbi:hypothetical protein SLH46_05310 [Draconibacterium sp. IB214405]|uniref:cell division protein FtsQ/DivIB n=1 Tax=Draconibacterium sp. IB214405 TaxID=3097352 RepID=UPI002A141A74|nr:hypothetical protein [Draconibacterium sp. IB214405]MDX8338589.1 hypothetical protein [Draconibacterium sp. IB214405]